MSGFAREADATPRDDAIRLLARREYARAELRNRLTAKDHSPEAVEACLDELVEQGLQSDARFAESFLRSRVARGQGPVRIRAELSRRGIDADTARAAFDEAGGEVDWFELAAETLGRRFSGPGEGPKERARRERFLAGRGFDFDQLRHAMAHAWDDA
ncbi:regulatory protein RecX [Halomonas getboli]|uniref:regulatory protein RecX n=1 Tax=Halomonas getboli TaxID=2935862 RepID=UPI001FFFA12E|nr:regulatory protein RecX [Halomonas getboli]MCK2184619.1 recombination regulator RecX [Halomonas getboli]